MSSLPKPLGQPWMCICDYSSSKFSDWDTIVTQKFKCLKYRPMKLNSTATFTFALLVLMVGAGVFSSMGGFSLGSEALKGVTQPDSRPNKSSSSNNSAAKPRNSGQAEITLMKEEDILKTAKEKVNSSLKAGAKPDPGDQKDKFRDPSEDKKTTGKFPFIHKDKGVTFEVTASRRQDDTLLLDLALKNDSDQPVKFLYSFLTITDDQGRILNGETTGLPSELLAKSDRSTGTVKISSALLANASKVSLQLSDYPNQKIQLEVSDIPVK